MATEVDRGFDHRRTREFVPSTGRIYEAVLRQIEKLVPHSGQLKHLDIGAGNGFLLKLISDRFGFEQRGCDYTAQFIKHSNVPIDVVDLDRQPLPYPDSCFDLVTCVETIEHLENFRALFREIHRVLRPGGVVIITTPNILNLRSRLRFLSFGFYNMFGPLHIRKQDNFDTRGHIAPTSWFYLGHALLQAGFVNLEATVDRWQRRSLLPLAFLYLPIRLIGALCLARERRDNISSITSDNESLVRDTNRLKLMLGRTLIISAQKETFRSPVMAR